MYTVTGRFARIQTEKTKRILIFGDLHGDLEALRSGLSKAVRGDAIIFLGDYADRGPHGVEVIETIRKIRELKPTAVLPLKGNHEDYTAGGEPTFQPCSLIGEAERKRNGWSSWFPSFSKFIDSMLLSALIPGFALCVHGGITGGIRSDTDLENPSPELERNILWSDPGEKPGERLNIRGAGKEFGPDTSDRVAAALGVNFIIRSHEPRKAAGRPFFEHNGRIVTLNSTSVYGGQPHILLIDSENLPETSEDLLSCTVYL